MNIRTIMIFPEFDNIDIIENIRKKYDPLYSLVNPHITLVFPFEDNMTNEELKSKIEDCLKDIKPFKLSLKGFSSQEDRYGNYLFLNVIEGVDELINIHNILYKGIWGNCVNTQTYLPHMTIGKLKSVKEMNDAFAKIENRSDLFETTLNKVSVEMIGENDESIIIIEKSLS